MADISIIQLSDNTQYNIKDAKARNNLANEFSISSTYAVGDIVLYQGDLYECTTAVTTAGVWDSSKWTQTKITNGTSTYETIANHNSDMGIINSQIDKIKDDFVENENLIYNVGKVVGVYLNSDTGATFNAGSYTTSDFIPVTNSTQYSITYKSSVSNLTSIRYLEYDSNKNYLSVWHKGNSSNETFTTTASTKYIRVSAPNGVYTNKLILCENPLIYGDNTHSLFLDGKYIKNDSIDGDAITAKSINLESLKNFVITSDNIYNPNNAIKNNYMLNADTGLLGAMNSYSVTDFQKIEASTQYTSNHVRGVFLYDENKNYIKYWSDTSYAPITFTTTANTKFYRFYTSTSNLDKIKLGKGSTAPTDDFKFIIRGIDVQEGNQTTNISDLLYNKETQVKIKLLGDSITYGVGASNRLTTSWAALLKSNLEAKFNCSVTNSAVSGTNSEYIVTNISTLISDTDDIVICMIGTNNRITENGFNRLYPDLQTIYDYCLERAIKFIPMCSLPASISDEEREDGTFSVRYRHMEDISHVISAFSMHNKLDFIDLFHEISNYCFVSGTTLNSLLDDGLHPNDDGYYVMYKYISHALGVDSKIENATW